MSNLISKLSIKQLFTKVKEYFFETVDENVAFNLEVAEYKKTSKGYEVTISYYVTIQNEAGLSSIRPPIKSYKTFILNNLGGIEKIEFHEFSK